MATTFDKKAHVTSLIGNGWEETDRTFLESLTDDKLAKIQPKPTTAKEPAPQPTPTPVANAAAAPDQLSADERRQLNRLLVNERARKETLADKILAGQAALNIPPERRFKKEFLLNKEQEELEAWATTFDASEAKVAESSMFQLRGCGRRAPVREPSAGRRDERGAARHAGHGLHRRGQPHLTNHPREHAFGFGTPTQNRRGFQSWLPTQCEQSC